MTEAPAEQASTPGAVAPAQFQCEYSQGFPRFLEAISSSLVVSTFRSNKVFFLRARDGVLSAHFSPLDRPAGIAFDERGGNRLYFGGATEIHEYRNVPTLAQRLEPPGHHDACFVRHAMRSTGDVQIHDLAVLGDEVWFVNSRFSCLSVMSDDFSFVPRWRPPFISAYDAQDRCHLNGMAVRDGAVCYASAFAETDAPGGWRAGMDGRGGVIMEVPSGRVVVRDLLMPHSPRWYQNHLWFMDSGFGTLCRHDPRTGTTVRVAEFPGFTRGLDFFGPLAFVGVSRVREKEDMAALRHIPRPEGGAKSRSGVWIYNIDLGKTVAFAKFADAVNEIYDVCILANILYPDLLAVDHPLRAETYVLPDDVLGNVVDSRVAKGRAR